MEFDELDSREVRRRACIVGGTHWDVTKTVFGGERKMRNTVPRPAPLRRRLGACATACLVVIALGPAARAGTVLGFGQNNPKDVITATESGGVTTLSTA